MAARDIKETEYILSFDQFKKPEIKKGQQAVALLLLRLILLDPGSDPLHPDMGVGIRKFRYSMNTIDQLRKRVQDQIATYLPTFHGAQVELEITADKLCNIKIWFNEDLYVYDSNEAEYPITLDSVLRVDK